MCFVQDPPAICSVPPSCNASCFVQLLAHPLSVSLLACTGEPNPTILLRVGADVAGDQGEGLHVHRISFKANNVMYEGIEIAVICDVRDVAADLYDFSFKEGTNQARFSKPTLAAIFREDKTELDGRLAIEVDGAQYVIDGRDAARVVYQKNVQKKGAAAAKKTFDVQFPAGFKLSQRAFDKPAGKEGEYTSAFVTQILYTKPIGGGVRFGYRPATPFAREVAGREPVTVHVQLSWRFANAAKETELTVAGARGVDAILASLDGL
jgi:hypothetical protein